jgi:hypothetical protein
MAADILTVLGTTNATGALKASIMGLLPFTEPIRLSIDYTRLVRAHVLGQPNTANPQRALLRALKQVVQRTRISLHIGNALVDFP